MTVKFGVSFEPKLLPMQIREVKTDADKKIFLEMVVDIYKNDENWVRPLNRDIEMVFDESKNKAFRHGECKRWLLEDDNGKVIGRFATFTNKKYKAEQPTGGIGFFECINNQEAANKIFDFAKEWLKERGMEAMDGPINFGERNNWWGLQVEGFQEPMYLMNYNPRYYKELFENYGFETYFDQFCYSLQVKDRLQDKFYERHAVLSKDPNYKAMHIKKSQMPKFIKDFAYIYNKAWASHFGGKDIDERQVAKMMEKLKPIMDEKICWFTYYKDEPVAFWVNMPDLNQYFQHFNGKFGLWEKLRFLWMKRYRKPNRFTGIVFGIIPEFQGKGVDAYMIIEAAKVIQDGMLYEKFELQWIGDWNPKMINIAESLGTKVSRQLKTYRYMFDRSKKVTRHPELK